jgi:hypothetical protein
MPSDLSILKDAIGGSSSLDLVHVGEQQLLHVRR